MRPLTLATLVLLTSTVSARVESPLPQPSANRYSDALKAAWIADPRSVVHELAVDRLESFPAQGAFLGGWDFSSLTNTSGNTRNLDVLDASHAFADVTGTNLCLHARAGGHLQVGKNKAAGQMRLTMAAAENRTALMTLFRHGTDTDGTVTVGCLGEGGETVILARPFLTLVPTEFAVPVPDAAQTLVLQSRSSRRIRVRDVRIVADYVAAFATTNSVLVLRTSASRCTARGLRPGAFLWRVRSFDWEGNPSAWSPAVTETLDPNAPEYPKGLTLRLR